MSTFVLFVECCFVEGVLIEGLLNELLCFLANVIRDHARRQGPEDAIVEFGVHHSCFSIPCLGRRLM